MNGLRTSPARAAAFKLLDTMRESNPNRYWHLTRDELLRMVPSLTPVEAKELLAGRT